jgi:TatD DNase family protein
MFKGIYHGKQCHAGDIPTVLARAWAAGVDRIIVRPPAPPLAVSSLPWSLSIPPPPFLGLLRLQVTGGSLKESREALEISETDGELHCRHVVHLPV